MNFTAYNLGFDAHFDDGENPYEYGTEDWDEFEAGREFASENEHLERRHNRTLMYPGAS